MTAAATCWGRSNYHCGGDGGGNLSGGSTLFLSQCQQWLMKAVSGGSGGGGWQLAADDSVDGSKRQQRVTSSPVATGSGEAIVRGQWTMVGGRRLVGGRIIT